jgi:hypothetical protein
LGTHWYSREGRDVYTTECKTKPGTFRDTHKGDAKKHGYLPSVTSIMGEVIYSDQLHRWSVNGSVAAAYNNPPEEGETELDYTRRIARVWKEAKGAAPELGTAVHDAIEAYLRGEEYDKALSPYTQIAEKFLRESGINMDHIEYTFANATLGYGGKVDIVGSSAAHHFIVDWKTKSRYKEGSAPWIRYGVQLEAYARGIGLPHARLINVMMSTEEAGKWEAYEWPMWMKEQLWKIFQGAYELWTSPMFANWDPRQWKPTTK